MTPATAKKWCRKALYSPLPALLVASGVVLPSPDQAKAAISYPGLSFNRNALLTAHADADTIARYVRVSNHWTETKIIEMGNDPRIEGNGFFKVGIFTQAGAGEDVNDTLAGIIGEAYAYNTVLERGGIRVTIGRQEPGDVVPADDAWLYSSLDVHWDVWRTT